MLQAAMGIPSEDLVKRLVTLAEREPSAKRMIELVRAVHTFLPWQCDSPCFAQFVERCVQWQVRRCANVLVSLTGCMCVSLVLSTALMASIALLATIVAFTCQLLLHLTCR